MNEANQRLQNVASHLPSPNVQLIMPSPPVPGHRLRVAAYCRVSTDLLSQESSISGQRQHYRERIAANPDWELAGIYWESGVSGTGTDKRTELARLLTDCEQGRIDLILTKSISRFARNTADCLRLVRRLNGIGVHLHFEKERIYTEELHSELMLTLLAAFAEEESRSISSNMRWSIRRRFEDGTYRPARLPYGYKMLDNMICIDPVEADTVRRIFSAFLSGQGAGLIARELNDAGIPTRSETLGRMHIPWTAPVIRRMAKNPFYTGTLLCQQTYIDEHFSQHINRGERTQYLHPENHPAILTPQQHDRAVGMIAQHAKECGVHPSASGNRNRSCFSGTLRCASCGGRMYRGQSPTSGGVRHYYRCQEHVRSRHACPMENIYEEDVRNSFCTLLNKLVWLQAGQAENRILDRYLDDLREAREAQEAIACALTRELRQALAQRRIRFAFSETDADIYARFVERAIVDTGRTITFCFMNGLRLSEGLGGVPRQSNAPRNDLGTTGYSDVPGEEVCASENLNTSSEDLSATGNSDMSGEEICMPRNSDMSGEEICMPGNSDVSGKEISTPRHLEVSSEGRR